MTPAPVIEAAGEMLATSGLKKHIQTWEVTDPQPGLAAHCLEAALAHRNQPEDDVTLVVAAIE